MATIFSKIVAGEIPCYKVAEDDKFFAFLDINPLVKGHTLVIPKQEVDYIFDLSDEDLAAMHVFAKKVALAIGKAFPCRKVGEAVLGLEVPHAHIHLIPMQNEKDMLFSNPKLKLTDEEFKAAYDMGAILNLDDISHIDAVLSSCGCLPKTLCFRYNPGPERTGNAIIGNPVEAKYGLTKVQLVEAYKRAKSLGVETFGLHTMVASNELDPTYIVETARMIFSLVDMLSKETGVRISFVDLGGGVGIPYKKSDTAISFSYLGDEIRKLYESMIVEKGYGPIKVTFEMGRAITGPFGYLVSTVRHVCRKYKDYVGLDACMADLMRPALYGAYHHITVLGKEGQAEDHVYDVTGSLCENNDKFAVDRSLPEIEEGDVLVIHDTGAHGHSMGFNYNAKLRQAEYLIGLDGKISRIRRNETFEDYVRTMLYDPEEVM